METMFALVPEVRVTAEGTRTCPVTYSPMLPALALLFVVVPTMPLVCEGVKAPVDVSAAVVTVPVNVGEAVGAAPRFVSAAAALVAPVPPCATDSAVERPESEVILLFAPDVAIAELQPNPEPFVHWSACAAPLHPVTVIAVGLALEPVALPTTVLAACAARLASPILPVAVNVPLTVALFSVAVPCDVTLLNVGLG